MKRTHVNARSPLPPGEARWRNGDFAGMVFDVR